MTTNFTIVRNSINVPVIDKLGRFIEDREMANIPFPELYQDEPFVIIDWKAADAKKPTIEELMAPVEYDDQLWYGCFGWGSAVKTGQTLGFLRDIPRDLIVNNEDGQRVSAWLTAMGLYGSGQGTFKIGILKMGQVLPGAGPVHDGFGYVRRDLAETFMTPQDPIKLGRAKEAWSFWQRLEWTPELEKESQPLIEDFVLHQMDSYFMIFDQSTTFDIKKELVEIEKEMAEHPYVANALIRSQAEYLARKAFTVPTDGEIRVAVPTTADQVIWPGHTGDIAVYRHPIDSFGSIQYVNAKPFDAESQRIADLEVVQYRFSGHEIFAKGCLGLVDALPNDWDIVVCADDIKLAKAGLKETRQQIQIEQDGVLTFTQRFAKGCAFGINVDWAKDLMGFDVDGDLGVLVDLNERPALKAAIQNMPDGETPKLTKTHRPIENADLRAEMIYKSMANLVGFATIVTAATFMVKDREMLALQLGFSSAQAMDKSLNYFIKAGTDGFKTDIDLERLEKQLSRIQSNMIQLLGMMAPWPKCPDSRAFTRMIPAVIEHVIPVSEFFTEYKIAGCDEPVQIPDSDLIYAIHPWMDGTIPQIARMVLPHIRNILSEPIKTAILTTYRPWAMQVARDRIEQAKVIQNWYNARAARTNWMDAKSIVKLKIDLAKEIETWIERERIDRKVAASALWRVAHSSRSDTASAASVFLAFYEECKWIIAEKPGLAPSATTILTGVSYQVPNLFSAAADGEIVDVEVVIKGKRFIRKAFVAEIEGQIQPRNPMYPRNMIGMVAANADQPACGAYTASIQQVSQGAWQIHLTTV